MNSLMDLPEFLLFFYFSLFEHVQIKEMDQLDMKANMAEVTRKKNFIF